MSEAFIYSRTFPSFRLRVMPLDRVLNTEQEGEKKGRNGKDLLYYFPSRLHVSPAKK